MLPMMNEIDKRAVVEINNEHINEGSNLVGNDTNFIDRDNNGKNGTPSYHLMHLNRENWALNSFE